MLVETRSDGFWWKARWSMHHAETMQTFGLCCSTVKGGRDSLQQRHDCLLQSDVDVHVQYVLGVRV